MARKAEARRAHVAVVVQLIAAPSASDAEVDTIVRGPLLTILDLLDGEPDFRLNLHLSGVVLEGLSRDPAALARLRTFWKEDRVEILGGPHHQGVLGALPERDARGQIQLHGAIVQQHLGRTPTGLSLPARAWEPALLPLLVECGVRYTIVDDLAFRAAGLSRDAVFGPWQCSKAGRSLGVFAHDGELGNHIQAADTDAWSSYLADRARPTTAPECVDVVCVDLFATRWEPVEVLRWTAGNSHAVRTWTLSRARDVLLGRGTVVLGGSIDPRAAAALILQSPDAGRRLRRRRIGAWSGASEPNPSFENAFLRYDEAGRLASRWRRVSERGQQLREVLQARSSAGQSGDSDRKARKLLERVCEAVWRAQYHGNHWFHEALPDGGIYERGRHHRVVRELLAADRLLDRVLGDPTATGWAAEVADVDGDGFDEALVRTPWLSLLVRPSRGGGLSELDLRDRGVPLLGALTPIEEPFHAGISGTEIRLVTDSGEDLAADDAPPPSTPLLAAATVEGVPRGVFRDHFLAPESTARAYARRQFRDLGEFAVFPFELVRVQAPAGESGGEVLVGRTGTVRDVGRTQLLRIDRAFRPDPGKPRLSVTTRLQNRSREAATVWYGQEWTLGTPDAAKVTIRAFGDDGPTTLDASDGFAEVRRVSGVEWEDRGLGTAVVVHFPEPMDLWVAAIETIHPGAADLVRTVTGHSFLVHAPVQLWGGDGHEITLVLDLLAVE